MFTMDSAAGITVLQCVQHWATLFQISCTLRHAASNKLLPPLCKTVHLHSLFSRRVNLIQSRFQSLFTVIFDYTREHRRQSVHRQAMNTHSKFRFPLLAERPLAFFEQTQQNFANETWCAEIYHQALWEATANECLEMLNWAILDCTLPEISCTLHN